MRTTIRAVFRTALVAAALLGSACGGSSNPQISVFTAAPSTIEIGERATLVFAADSQALSIDNGVGDVTGRTEVSVSPTVTTTYTLTATREGKTKTATVTVTVTPASPLAFKLEPAGAFTAGQAVNVKVTAINRSGGVSASYRGTVHISSDDAAAVLPADLTFAAADAGVKTAAVTLKTAGARLLTAADTIQSSAKGTISVSVAPGAVAALRISGIPAAAKAGDALAATITAVDAFGNVATGYARTVTLHTGDTRATLAPPRTFTAQDAGSVSVALSFATTGSWTVRADDDSAPQLQVVSGAVAVDHAAPAAFRLLDLAPEAGADEVVTFRIRVEDRFGNRATGYRGTVHVTLTDASAPAVADVVFGPTQAGEATPSAVFFASGMQSILASDGAIATSAELKVKNASAIAYALSGLPGASMAGEALPLTIKALDRHGNVVQDYAPKAHVSSADPTDRLPVDGSFSSGVLSVAVEFRSTGDHQVTVAEVSGSITATSGHVTVFSADASSIALTSSSGTPAAGQQFDLTARVRDLFANTVASYTGTVHLSSDDVSATLPDDYKFVAADAGQHTFQVTLKKAGTQRIFAADTPNAALSGSGTVTVSHAAASVCAISGLPASTTAGTQLALRVKVSDGFGNVATGYVGTIVISATDARATLSPATATYDPAVDSGLHAFGATLITTGAQRITAADGAINCQAGVDVSPAALHLEVAVPPDPMAGVQQTTSIALKDAFANPVARDLNVNLSTTDSAAVGAPTTVALTAGIGSANLTFRTVGSASVNAVSAADAQVTGAAVVSVHGLVYTDPALGLGKVRLLRNASSRGDQLQLDLVSSVRLITSGGAATRRNGAYAVAMNIPVPAGRIILDPITPLVEGTVLNLGTAPKAVGAVLKTTGPAANVLISGASQKMAGGGAVTGDATVLVNQIYYSLKVQLAPGANAGTVFDGSALPVAFKASVRDRSGVDTIRLEDFALGKLEIR